MAPKQINTKDFTACWNLILSANLVFTVYGDYASAAKIYDKVVASYKNNGAFVGSLFLGYKQTGCFSIGVEGFIKSQKYNYAVNSKTALTTQNGNGISVVGICKFN